MDGLPGAGDDAIDLGTIPEEVLLRLGRPHAVPDEAWTPGLAALGAEQRAAVLAASDERLRGMGWLDDEGRASGALAPLAQLVAGTRAVVRFETAHAVDGDAGEGAFLIGEDRVLLLVHQQGTRAWEAQALRPHVAVAALALGLDPFGLAPGTAPDRPTTDVEPTQLAGLLPAARRRSTVRLVRVAAEPGHDGGREETMLTVVAQDDGVAACGALPNGAVRVQWLGRDALIELAIVVLDSHVQRDAEVMA